MYLLSNWRRQGISRVQLEWSTDNCNSVSNTETSISSGILPHRQGKHLEKSKLGYFSKSNKGINRKKTPVFTLVVATPGRCSRDVLTTVQPGLLHTACTSLVYPFFFSCPPHSLYKCIFLRIFFIKSTKFTENGKWRVMQKNNSCA